MKYKEKTKLGSETVEDTTRMDECESLDSEVVELQEFQSELSEAVSQDDEDELEELQKRCYFYWDLQTK